jgi:hypothetical protein
MLMDCPPEPRVRVKKSQEEPLRRSEDRDPLHDLVLLLRPVLRRCGTRESRT